ncbi:hypothetical protein WMY93_009946 [Mugilogobius chulae]|uniref:Uncharacterized protein n=1 Tax=Mugilogobius chulae TaxID=88201 RepID=A0AAW0PF19_9GOBI
MVAYKQSQHISTLTTLQDTAVWDPTSLPGPSSSTPQQQTKLDDVVVRPKKKSPGLTLSNRFTLLTDSDTLATHQPFTESRSALQCTGPQLGRLCSHNARSCHKHRHSRSIERLHRSTAHSIPASTGSPPRGFFFPDTARIPPVTAATSADDHLLPDTARSPCTCSVGTQQSRLRFYPAFPGSVTAPGSMTAPSHCPWPTHPSTPLVHLRQRHTCQSRNSSISPPLRSPCLLDYSPDGYTKFAVQYHKKYQLTILHTTYHPTHSTSAKVLSPPHTRSLSSSDPAHSQFIPRESSLPCLITVPLCAPSIPILKQQPLDS